MLFDAVARTLLLVMMGSVGRSLNLGGSPRNIFVGCGPIACRVALRDVPGRKSVGLVGVRRRRGATRPKRGRMPVFVHRRGLIVCLKRVREVVWICTIVKLRRVHAILDTETDA